MKSSHIVTESTAKLYNHFLARSFREKGMKCNLTASSSSWGMRIMRHTSSNYLIKKYALFSLDLQRGKLTIKREVEELNYK